MPELPPLNPEDLDAARAATIARGRVLRRRRRALLAVGPSAGLLVFALLVGTVAGGDPEAVQTTDATTTSVERTTTSTESTSTTAVQIDTTSTTIETTSTTEAPAPPEPMCVTATGTGSGPDADWSTRWQTEPAFNDPATVELCVDDITPAVGQVVTATVTTSDPDAPYLEECGAIVFWRALLSYCRDIAYQTPPEPQPTPTERPGTYVEVFQHTYEEPLGAVVIRGVGWSGELLRPHYENCSCGVHSPYTSYASAELTLIVG